MNLREEMGVRNLNEKSSFAQRVDMAIIEADLLDEAYAKAEELQSFAMQDEFASILWWIVIMVAVMVCVGIVLATYK